LNTSNYASLIPTLLFRNSRFNIEKPYVLTRLFVLCVYLRTGIVSSSSINCSVFIKEMECVYCAVRTECLKLTLILVFKG
jgi:hypothetical protein